MDLLIDILLDAGKDTLSLVPFLLVTYLVLETLEHVAGDRVNGTIKRAGAAGPVVGSLLGMVPQCGFSAMAATLYAGRVVTLGTLVAVFLSTSDEMLPLLLAEQVPVQTMAMLLASKALIALVTGFIVDAAIRGLRRNARAHAAIRRTVLGTAANPAHVNCAHDDHSGGDIIDEEQAMLDVVEMDEWKKDNDYFSITVMQEDSKRLTNFYTDRGYAFAEVDTRVMKVEGDEPMVDVGYMVNKKEKVFIRRLMVDGNTKTRDNVILREMRLGDGDQYEGEKMRRSAERLNRLRYFSAIDSELIPTDRPDEVDLKIKVKEDNTGALMGGIGYSTYYDVGVTASIMERNLFGRGYQVQLQGFFSWRRTSGVFSFTNPRVYDTDLSFGNDIYYIYDYWDDFTKETIGDTIRFGYPIGEYTSVGIGYRLERYDLYNVDADASPYISDYKGTNWTSAISARILRDTTDDRARPTRGTIARLWAEYGGGGLGGTDNFIKAVADWQGFWSINPENTFHLRARVGGVFQNTSSRVPVFERFWLGGMDTVRGYSYSDLSPRDDKYGGDQIGGDRMGVLNVEYIWTFQKDMGLALVPFFDAGFNIDHKTMADDFNDKIVYSAGLELRWRSPMGDLRLAYGYPLSKDYDGEREQGRLEFSMGQFF